MVSGCSLQEFAELLEALVMDNRINGDDQLELKIKETLDEVNGEVASDASQPIKGFRLNNPLLLDNAQSLSTELHKHMQEYFKESEITDIQHELQRNYNFRDKLQQICNVRKLTDAEVRRLENVNQAIHLLEEELSKEKHISNLVASK
ncbi:Recombination inhibitory 2 [Babesia ovata]|uniref:Recombination inhibitory 2 n=1 Tax=Babesia ovata TaxID=189622 RepID=A0A2H6KHG0_9APIC|nr:Recombination inhibitory 2 [Babesia ovata]GBE62437.1 Recombination inhibitory 2 [Babesia ovata]